MRGALLVPDEHMVYLRVQEVVVDRYDHSSGIPEHDLDAFSFQQR